MLDERVGWVLFGKLQLIMVRQVKVVYREHNSV